MLSNEEISSFIFTKENIKDGKQVITRIEGKKRNITTELGFSE